MFAKLFELRNKKLKDNKKKGFTLVELIVVLVILAILAALLIPTLTGYINKAKEKSIVAETRQAVMAAQTLVDEAYGKLDLTAADNAIVISTDAVEGKTVVKISDIATLAEVKEANITSAIVTAGKVMELVYTNDGKTCTYKAGTDGGKGKYEVNDVK